VGFPPLAQACNVLRTFTAFKLSMRLPPRCDAEAAGVALKERRKLILVPRESPLSLLHLRTLTTLAEAGAIIAPAMPVFYTHPDTLNDSIDFVAGRVLDLCGIDNELLPRWGADA
jgi:4-hydroxy-3-polyprenylbenzoate decarboxylase